MAIVEQESIKETLKDPAKYRKAIMGGLLAGVTAAATAADDGFTSPEFWGIASAVVATFVGVFGVYNTRS